MTDAPPPPAPTRGAIPPLAVALKRTETECLRHGDAFFDGSRRWRNFAFLVALLGLAGVVGEHFILLNLTDETKDVSVLYAGAGVRIFTAFIVFWLLSFCFRNYRVQRHQEVLYRHRELCAGTLSALFETHLQDDVTKREMIPTLAKNVFEPTSSGFLTKGDKDYAPLEFMAEAVKGLLPGKS